jgi:hypothetical protein
MGSLKVWDGTQWVAISKQAGPQGAVGAVATILTPAGPAGGDLQGRYPDPEVKRVKAGTLLDVQRDVSSLAANWYNAPASGGNFEPSLTYTPEVNAWWDVHAQVALNKQDAAYHYSYLFLILSPSDMDGYSSGGVIHTQNTSVQTNSWRSIRRLFRLAAGTTYTCVMRFISAGGTWQYHSASHLTFIEAKVWAQ